MSLFPFALTYKGMAALCLSMSRHARELLQREPTPLQRHLPRTAGWIAVTLSLSMTAARAGWPIGTVGWFGMLTATAVSFVLLLSYYPGWPPAWDWDCQCVPRWSHSAQREEIEEPNVCFQH